MATEIIWTALPNGVAHPDELRLSVFVSPRVDTGPMLAGSIFDAWASRPPPALVVRYEGGPDVDAKYTPGAWPKPDPKRYERLLPGSTPTRPYEFKDQGARRLRSYSVRRTLGAVRSVYEEVALTSGTEFPSMSAPPPQLAALFRALAVFLPNDPNGSSILTQIAHLGEGQTRPIIQSFFPNDPAGAELAFELYRAYRFYKRDTRDDYPLDPQPLPARPPLPVPDFHQIVALLGDYPTLLRELGFVFDYIIPPPPPALAEGRLRLHLHDPPAGAVNHTPFTEYRLTEEGFFARSKSPDLHDGLLQLGLADFFEIYQADADGAVLKAWDYALAMVRRQALPDPPERESLPAQRAGGISVALTDRAAAITARLAVAAAHNVDPNNASLDAHDLRRGYRIDVRDESGKWRSLCRRVGTMTVDHDPVPPAEPDREGYVKSSAGASSAKPGEPDDLYMHEALFGWDGWSLVASRPGRTITFDEGSKHEQVSKVAYVANEAVTTVPLSGAYSAAPRSLPRLRFGRAYTLRARVVDLAGNSFAFDDDKLPTGPGPWESPPVTYRRFEPVPPPALVPTRPVTEGESLEHLVIRSNYDASASEYATRLAPFGSNYLPYNERHVAPPKTTQINAETHGMLDGLPPEYAYNVSVKEAGTFLDTEIFDPSLGGTVPVADIELVTPAACPPEEARMLPLVPRGTALGPGQYVIHKGATVQLPYLPDPLSIGLVLQGLDPNGPVVVPFNPPPGNPWPDFRCFRLRALETSGDKVTYEFGDGELRVFLPKATILRLRMSSLPDPARRNEHAHWSVVDAGPDVTMKVAAELGQHWMVTPPREIALVHAQQQPLERALFLDGGPSPNRYPGETFTRLSGSIKVHGRSTSRVDVRAEWTDSLDLVDQPGPEERPYRAAAFDLGVDYHDEIVAFGMQSNQVKHEFGDTKHHLVTYVPDGTTRYREYLPPGLTADPKNLVRDGHPRPGVIIKNSALPDPPKVLYAVPTFHWDVTNGAKQLRRHGRGLRIYLDRPWYSSGNGEQLAVILEQPGATDERRLKYVSEWGGDPTWKAKKPGLPLAVGDFEGGTPIGPLPLADDPTIAVIGRAYTPQYHEGRRLWFVDVVFAASVPQFYTFARLGLARYQEHSVEGMHLSRVVRTEFGQIMADRTMSIAPTLFPTQFNVSLSGAAGINSYGVSYNTNRDLLAGAPPPLPGALAIEPSTGASPHADAIAAPSALPAISALPAPPPPPKPDANAGRSFRVTAQFERRDLSLGPEFDLSWEPVSLEQPLASFTGPGLVFPPGSQLTWKAGVTMGTEPQLGFEYRVVVREYERFATDQDVQDGQHNYQPGVGVPHEPLRFAERVSFVGVLPLPPSLG